MNAPHFKLYVHCLSLYIIYYILLLLTAIGLSPGDSSPTLVQTKIKIHKTTITTTKTTKNKKNIKQQNNYQTIKISTQIEHSKCKYYKNTHTYYKTYEIKTTIADDT
jgi:ABC-type microcin C transport system permease subunit YejE